MLLLNVYKTEGVQWLDTAKVTNIRRCQTFCDIEA